MHAKIRMKNITSGTTHTKRMAQKGSGKEPLTDRQYQQHESTYIYKYVFCITVAVDAICP